MKYEDRSCCPYYAKICSGVLPDTCANCPYYRRIKSIMKFGKIALAISALIFIVTTKLWYCV